MLGDTFSYTDFNTYTVRIDNNTKVKIYRTTMDVAIVYFTDNNNNKIHIPNGMVMHNNVEKYNLPSRDGKYYVARTSSYTLFYNNKVVFHLENPRIQIVKLGVGYEQCKE